MPSDRAAAGEAPVLTSLPTRAELAARCRAFARDTRGYDVAQIAAVVVFLAGQIPAAFWLARHGVGRWAIAVPFLTMLAVTGALDVAIGRAAKRHGLTCPSCRRRLAGAHVHRVVATGSCRCGARVARDDSDRVRALPSREEIAARLTGYLREGNRLAGWFMVPMLVAMAVSVAFYSWLDGSGFEALWFLPLGLLVALVAGYGVAMGRVAERYGLACPSCGQSLPDALGKLALATGHCGRCGARLARA